MLLTLAEQEEDLKDFKKERISKGRGRFGVGGGEVGITKELMYILVYA